METIYNEKDLHDMNLDAVPIGEVFPKYKDDKTLEGLYLLKGGKNFYIEMLAVIIDDNRYRILKNLIPS